MRILLLEDSPTDADLTQRSLTKSIPGCVMLIASTLKDARSLIKNEEGFDVALLDMALPDGNGQELLVEIRRAGIDMAVVMLTGSGNEEVAVAALKAGADDYVIKRQGYISHLSMTIHFAIESYKHNKQSRTDQLKLLYIEHNNTDLDLTLRHLRQYSPNIVVETAVTAEAALLILPHEAPCNYQVILMDYRLPGLNALEFIKIIRQERNLDIPLILVSGQGNEDIAVQALKLGASEYLVKRENYLFRLPTLITSVYQHYELMRSQRALKESEAKYRLIAENSGDVIFTLDLDMNYTYISPAIRSLRGYTPEEAMKQKISEILTPDSYRRAVKLISVTLYVERKLINNLAPQRTIELEMIRKDGTTVWTEVKASLISDEYNHPVGIIGVTRDISERKFAMDELRKLSRAVEQSADSILITNIKGEIEYVNPALTRISGYTSDELIGKNPRVFSSDKTPISKYETLWHTITKGNVWEGEFRNKKKNGEEFWEATTISPVTDGFGKIAHYLAIRKDITEKKRMVEELIEAKEHAEESDRLKSAFLANMSHEIRTPLNSIIGFSDLLNDPDFDEEQKSEFTKSIINNGNNLLVIISDIMDLSMIVAGQMVIKKEHFSAQKLLEDLENEYKREASDKGIEIRLTIPSECPEVIIENDKYRTRQILINLISNALKFTSIGFVEIGFLLKVNRIQFHVKDTGIGIAPEHFKAIFDRFRQVEITITRQYGGNGLGLAISKNLVELCGGRIWVESELGKGSTFYFSLPIQSQTNPDTASLSKMIPHTEEVGITNLKILIVEDDQSSSQLISISVRKLAKEIINVHSGTKAVEVCRNNPDIDLVLMDIQLPEMNGHEATRQIREFNSNVVIIAQTAFALSGDKEKALEAGCNDYISKPIKQGELVELMHKYFSK
ncbi:MAG: response regulator [Prolixibacteraceae bacterium]|nr:response regulator [Prolixibacteraceae bacterium]